jgi:hypothetical protein
MSPDDEPSPFGSDRSLNPYDVKNTLEKMAEKRALVAAVLIGVGASDIFTQPGLCMKSA